MSILGKLLIVLNLLAAGAFAYLTLENWKVRQDLTTAELQREIRLKGLPVEVAAKPPTGLSKEYVPFDFEVSSGAPRMESIQLKRLEAIIPQGGDLYGGGAVANQSDEIKRVQEKVIASVPAAGGDPLPRLGALRGYLLNVARTGAERDGINAVFDMRETSKADMARRDLPLIARSSSQTAALRLLVELKELGDPQAEAAEDIRASRIGLAREAVRRFFLGEVPHGVAGAADKDEAARKLTNALVATFDAKGNKEDVVAAAPADPTGFGHVADVAAQSLADMPSVEKASAALVAYATSKSLTPAESTGLTAVATLIRPPALNFAADAEIEKALLNLLNARFDEAALPTSGKPGTTVGEKARKIAHLLYHIDAHRHLDRTPAVVQARKAWHERVSAVVGLPEYVRAAEAQASEYAEAAQRLIAVISEEESAFRAQFQEKQQRVVALYTQWLTVDAQFRAQDAITKENLRLRAERETEKKDLEAKLAQATADARASLEQLRRTQARLFDIQRDLRDAQAALLALEGELRRLELGRKEKDRTGGQ